MGSGGIVTEQLDVELAAVPSELGGQAEEPKPEAVGLSRAPGSGEGRGPDRVQELVGDGAHAREPRQSCRSCAWTSSSGWRIRAGRGCTAVDPGPLAPPKLSAEGTCALDPRVMGSPSAEKSALTASESLLSACRGKPTPRVARPAPPGHLRSSL